MSQFPNVFGPDGEPHPENVVHLRPAPPRPSVPERYVAPALPMPPRRFLDVDQAAAYVGVGMTTFLEEVGQGMWPPPLRRGASGRRTTWDVRALDAAADSLSGIATAEAAPGAEIAEAAALARFR